MIELKPCPFCGCGYITLHEAYRNKDYEIRAWVRCEHCGAHVGDGYPSPYLFKISDSTEYAVRNWNRRATDELQDQ